MKQDRDIEPNTPRHFKHGRLFGGLQAKLIEMPGQARDLQSA